MCSKGGRLIDIKRDNYLNDLINCMHNGMIKVVTGIRRCGIKKCKIRIQTGGRNTSNGKYPI